MKQTQNDGYYRPLADYLYIDDSQIEGKGVFTRVFLPTGTDLGITHAYVPSIAAVRLIYPDGWIRSVLGSWYNHSKQAPNCQTITEIQDGSNYTIKRLVTLREVQPGEELTATYTLYDPES